MGVVSCYNDYCDWLYTYAVKYWEPVYVPSLFEYIDSESYKYT